MHLNFRIIMYLNHIIHCTRNVSCSNRSKILDCYTYMLPPQGIGNILSYRMFLQNIQNMNRQRKAIPYTSNTIK